MNAQVNRGGPTKALYELESRTYDSLPEDAWKEIDRVVVEEAEARFNIVRDFLAAGMVYPIEDAMAKTVLQWNKTSQVDNVVRSMDGVIRGQSDMPDIVPVQIPLYITHADFDLNLRELAASERGGFPLDTVLIQEATRAVVEDVENALVNGGGLTVGGNPVYGLATHPDINSGPFGTNGAWDQAAKTGENILDDVLTILAALHADRHYGPFNIYVPNNYMSFLADDFKANSDRTIMERILAVDQVQAVRPSESLSAEVIAVSMSRSVVDIVDGIRPTAFEWDTEGRFRKHMKVAAIMVPRVKSTHGARSGIYRMA